MNTVEIKKIEVDLLINAIYQAYGYDFRHYAQASLRRRVEHFLTKTTYKNVSELISPILHQPELANKLIHSLSITVTEMFRDPAFYVAIRQVIVPYLKTYPFVKIWHAGCATGEEVYSLAILLQEENLYDRVTIFATDFNEHALQQAQEGIYSLKNIQQYTINYQKAGGKQSFSDYYHAQYESAIMKRTLKKNITFANHNLVTDDVFSEIHLILCRNVLIYFNHTLTEKVLTLFLNSLSHNGFLCLGTSETIQFSSIESHFKTIDPTNKIYQKHKVA